MTMLEFRTPETHAHLDGCGAQSVRASLEREREVHGRLLVLTLAERERAIEAGEDDGAHVTIIERLLSRTATLDMKLVDARLEAEALRIARILA